MKKTLIITLVCLNVALVAMLMFGTTTRTAKGQAVRGQADYLMITGEIRRDYDAIYIIDLAKRRMLAWRLDRTRKVLIPYRGRDLRSDFDRPRAE